MHVELKAGPARLLRRRFLAARVWVLRSSFVACCAAASACGSAPEGGTEELAETTQAIDTNDPHIKKYLDPGLVSFLGLSDNVVSGYKAAASVIAINTKIAELLGIPPDASLEELIILQLAQVQESLRDVTNQIADVNWHQAEAQAVIVYNKGAYANSVAQRWSRSNSEPIARGTPPWNDIDYRSWTMAQTFSRASWYYWPYQAGVSRQNWRPENSNTIFDWRLALPRFMNAIATRVNALAVTHADFRTDRDVSAELLGYRASLKTYYDKIQNVAFRCAVVSPQTFSQADFSLLPIYCTSGVTGARLQAGTAGNPADLFPIQQQLMDQAGLSPVRWMMSNLYMLAWNITGSNAADVSKVEQVAFTGLGMCVEPNTLPATVHSQLVMRDCGGLPNLGKNWSLEYRATKVGGSDYAARLRYGDTDLCVNVPWAAAVVHNVMQLYPCSTSTPYPNEHFDHTAAGQLMYGGLCFNLAGGRAVDGAAVQLYPCVGAANEKWTLR